MYSRNFRAGLLLAALLAASTAFAGGGLTLVDEDFNGFAGSGFAPMPAAGQLDSDLWRATGFSADGSFGGTFDSGDFARGSSTGGVSTGGVYAFDTGANSILGIQPGSSDFTPGTLTLRLTNSSGGEVNAVSISYDIWTFNDQARANSLNFGYSLDDATYVSIPELDFTTPEAAAGSPAWSVVNRTIILNGLGLANGADLYLQWTGDDQSGGGSRDEYGIDNISVEAVTPPDVLISKTGPVFATAGEQITYQINVDNFTTSDTITSLTVIDDLPADTSYVSDTSGVLPDQSVAGQLTWALSDLAAGASLDFELVLSLDALAPSGPLVNDVTANGIVDGSPASADASWETTVVEEASIYDVQTVADPAVDDASPLVNQTIRVDGIVTSAPGGLQDNRGVTITVIQEPAGGPFSGLALIGDLPGLTLERGDEIRVVGEVAENFGQTELQVISAEFIQSSVVPAPELLDTGAFGTGGPGVSPLSEQWEGVLIEFTDVDVTDTPGFGEWLFTDGSGEARGDDAGVALTIEPAIGDSYSFLRGIGWYSFSNYKTQSRDNGDIGLVADVVSIEDIQGSALTSPFEGQVVRTEGNIVTAVGSDFFVIQMPAPALPPRIGDPASRGLHVFTDSAPSVAVGDEVTVQGAVVEFFDLTQIGFPDLVEVTGSGNPLPSPIIFDAGTPSLDPTTPSCGINNFECFESMRVTVSNGFITAPSQSFGSDPIAEAVVSANGERTLRGAGVEFPGIDPVICPDCPVWSGAPEQFELDPDRIALDNLTLAGGSTFSATGVIGYEFGDYELWPTELNVESTPDLPLPAPSGGQNELTIGSLNVLNLFDDIDDPDRAIPTCGAGYIAQNREIATPAEYQLKLDKLAETIVQALQSPDVLALQEVESLTTLQALAAAVSQAGGAAYTAYLVPGNDRGEINNGFLINTSRVAVDQMIQEGGDECLSLDNTPLHDRPSLTLEGRFIADGADWPFVVINNHLRSLGGIDSQARVRLKRHEQAQSVAAKVQARQILDPNLPIILVGDKNAFEFTDGYVDVIGLLSGTSVESQNLVNIENAGVPGFDPSNQVSPTLVNVLETLPAEERYSFLFRGVAQTLDHALLNRAANRYVSDYGYMRGNADYWEGFEADGTSLARSSDHDGLVLVLEPGRDIDILFGDRFESQAQ